MLDEPTTGLDDENARAVTDGLKAIARGRTTLLVSHDLDLVSRSDLILFLDGGKVLEGGTHEELMRANGRYAFGSVERVGERGYDARESDFGRGFWGDRAFGPAPGEVAPEAGVRLS